MRADEAVIGASTHYARAELVTVAVVDGVPVLLDRRRAELIAEGLPQAPYHHEALELEINDAIALVDRVKHSVTAHSHAALSAVMEAFPVGALVLEASPYDELPDTLQEVLSSRPLTNAADGMLYREALTTAALKLGMEVRRYPRKADPMTIAAEAMGVDATVVAEVIARFGREAGAPWRKDHKLATAAALSVLGERIRR